MGEIWVEIREKSWSDVGVVIPRRRYQQILALCYRREYGACISLSITAPVARGSDGTEAVERRLMPSLLNGSNSGILLISGTDTRHHRSLYDRWPWRVMFTSDSSAIILLFVRG